MPAPTSRMTVAPRLTTMTPDGQGAEVVRLHHVPARPALTPGLERRLRAESISLTSAEPTDDKAAARYRSDFLGTVEKPWRPSPLPASEMPAAQQALAAFDEYLRPQDWEDNGRAMRAIAALLSYYRQPDRAPNLEASIAEQWGEDVEDYPLWAVQEACRIWRREPDNRRGPHPGEFRAICEALVGKARQQRDRLRRCLEMPPLLSAPLPLTAEERTALEERRKSARMAELARFEEIKAHLLAEGKWPGRIAGPALSCDTPSTSDAKNIHCPSTLTPAACRTSGSGEEALSPGTPSPACPESVGAPALPEQPATTRAGGTASGPWTSDKTPKVTICGDDEIDMSLLWKAWPAGDLPQRQVTSGVLLLNSCVKEHAVSVLGSPSPVKRPEPRSSRALSLGHPAMVWLKPGLPICVQGWSLRSNLGRRCRRWNMSSPGRKAEALLSSSPAGDCFLQVTAEHRPPKGCVPIFRTFFGSVGKDKAGFARFRPGSMFSNASFRIGYGLTIRRSRRLDFAGTSRRDQGEVASRPSGRDQARSGGPAEVVRQMVRLFPCRDAGILGPPWLRAAVGEPSLWYFNWGQEPGRSIATSDGETVPAPKCPPGSNVVGSMLSTNFPEMRLLRTGDSQVSAGRKPVRGLTDRIHDYSGRGRAEKRKVYAAKPPYTRHCRGGRGLERALERQASRLQHHLL